MHTRCRILSGLLLTLMMKVTFPLILFMTHGLTPASLVRQCSVDDSDELLGANIQERRPTTISRSPKEVLPPRVADLQNRTRTARRERLKEIEIRLQEKKSKFRRKLKTAGKTVQTLTTQVIHGDVDGAKETFSLARDKVIVASLKKVAKIRDKLRLVSEAVDAIVDQIEKLRGVISMLPILRDVFSQTTTPALLDFVGILIEQRDYLAELLEATRDLYNYTTRQKESYKNTMTQFDALKKMWLPFTDWVAGKERAFYTTLYPETVHFLIAVYRCIPTLRGGWDFLQEIKPFLEIVAPFLVRISKGFARDVAGVPLQAVSGLAARVAFLHQELKEWQGAVDVAIRKLKEYTMAAEQFQRTVPEVIDAAYHPVSTVVEAIGHELSQIYLRPAFDSEELLANFATLDEETPHNSAAEGRVKRLVRETFEFKATLEGMFSTCEALRAKTGEVIAKIVGQFNFENLKRQFGKLLKKLRRAFEAQAETWTTKDNSGLQETLLQEYDGFAKAGFESTLEEQKDLLLQEYDGFAEAYSGIAEAYSWKNMTT